MDKFIDTTGIVAQSTQQVVGQSLIGLGLGLALVVVVAIVATVGAKALVNNARKRSYDIPNYVVIAPAE